MTTDPDPYSVLQVDPAAEMLVIQAAYRALARRFHPDGDAPNQNRMSELNAAYGVLRDPELRRKLDDARARARLQAVPITQQTSPASTSAAAPGWTARNSTRSTEATPVLDFGRYQGWSIADLARHDPDYLRWLSRHSSGLRYRDAIAKALPRESSIA